MNTAQLQAFVEAHKMELAAGGAVLVGGLALAKRKKAGAATPTAAGAAASPQTGLPGTATYDSSASDVYNSIQPELEQLQQLITQQSSASPIPVAAAPAPAPIYAPAPAAAAVPTAVPPPTAPGTHDQYYVIQAGDTLSKIAARFPQSNITWQSIYRDNSNTLGGNPNLIHPGTGIAIRGVNN